MAKKNVAKKVDAPATATGSTPTNQVIFPEVAAKSDLECRSILEDQIIIIDVSSILYTVTLYQGCFSIGFLFPR